MRCSTIGHGKPRMAMSRPILRTVRMTRVPQGGPAAMRACDYTSPLLPGILGLEWERGKRVPWLQPRAHLPSPSTACASPGYNPSERHPVHSPSLSVCIITYNEEENLPRCLASVAFADEIVVVDSQSTDRTVDIARQAGCRVISQAFLGYVAQKNLALRHASHQWVLCLDADEWLRPGAAAAIRATLATRAPDVAGYT